jgi:ABC-type antimicrobial peptide transport system permease subunit
MKKQDASILKVGSITFPLSEAFRFSLESIRKRFTRAFITAISVLLGIAFMVTILTMGTILTNVGEQPPESYQLWMVIIALVVCGVGIINSMLMSVTERYKEIGTIKCLGATDINVLEIFLIEALLLGILGGLIGAFAGWLAAVGIFGFQFGMEGVFPAANLSPVLLSYLTYIGEAVVIAAILSVGAAAYPAFYAARLNPADALRYEV